MALLTAPAIMSVLSCVPRDKCIILKGHACRRQITPLALLAANLSLIISTLWCLCNCLVYALPCAYAVMVWSSHKREVSTRILLSPFSNVQSAYISQLTSVQISLG